VHLLEGLLIRSFDESPDTAAIEQPPITVGRRGEFGRHHEVDGNANLAVHADLPIVDHGVALPVSPSEKDVQDTQEFVEREERAQKAVPTLTVGVARERSAGVIVGETHDDRSAFFDKSAGRHDGFASCAAVSTFPIASIAASRTAHG
jgi:hypothetical protein